MQSEILVAIIAAVGTIIVAAITSYFTTTRAIAQIQVKVDLLWKTYIVDAVAASRKAGMVATRSAEKPTEEWYLQLPDALTSQIAREIRQAEVFFHDPYDISMEVLKAMKDNLLDFSIEANVPMKEILGTIYIMAANQEEN